MDKPCDNILDNNKTPDESNDKNKKEENTWSQEDFDIFKNTQEAICLLSKKLQEESFSTLPKRSEILAEKKIEDENDVKTKEENEYLEDAKLWAVKQKSSLGLNKKKLNSFCF